MRIVAARRGGEFVPVNGITQVGGQSGVANCFGGLGARLGVLAGHPSNFHHRHRCPVGQNNRHLQEGADLGTDTIRGDLFKRFRAIPTHEDESFSALRGRDALPEAITFTRKNERWHFRQTLHDGSELCFVLVMRLVQRGLIAPGVGQRGDFMCIVLKHKRNLSPERGRGQNCVTAMRHTRRSTAPTSLTMNPAHKLAPHHISGTGRAFTCGCGSAETP